MSRESDDRSNWVREKVIKWDERSTSCQEKRCLEKNHSGKELSTCCTWWSCLDTVIASVGGSLSKHQVPGQPQAFRIRSLQLAHFVNQKLCELFHGCVSKWRGPFNWHKVFSILPSSWEMSRERDNMGKSWNEKEMLRKREVKSKRWSKRQQPKEQMSRDREVKRLFSSMRRWSRTHPRKAHNHCQSLLITIDSSIETTHPRLT